MSCGCANRRQKILTFIRKLFPAPVEKVPTDGSHPNVSDLLAILQKLGVDPHGPDTNDQVDKQTIVYQQTVTWIVDYDAKTNRCMQAKRREEDFRV